MNNISQQSHASSSHPDTQLPDFDLIETFRYEPCCGFLRLDQHLVRLGHSSAELGFDFQEKQVREQLKLYETGEQALRMRLGLTRSGILTITCTPYQALHAKAVWKLAIAETRLDSHDHLLAHKTTRRQVYEAARAEFSPEQADEVLLTNEVGEICEGTITSLFVDMGNGYFITPALQCGLLNGVLRQELIDKGIVKIGRITLKDLQQAQKLFIGNSLRGIIAAELAG